MKKLIVNLYDFKENVQDGALATMVACRGWSKNKLVQVVAVGGCRGWSRNRHEQVVRCHTTQITEKKSA